MLQHRDAMAHPDPERGVLLGFLLVDAAAKEAILFDEARPPDLRVADEELVETLTSSYCHLLDFVA
jgi:hypothetical protein